LDLSVNPGQQVDCPPILLDDHRSPWMNCSKAHSGASGLSITQRETTGGNGACKSVDSRYRTIEVFPGSKKNGWNETQEVSPAYWRTDLGNRSMVCPLLDEVIGFMT
jgi:hypothetical protein